MLLWDFLCLLKLPPVCVFQVVEDLVVEVWEVEEAAWEVVVVQWTVEAGAVADQEVVEDLWEVVVDQWEAEEDQEVDEVATEVDEEDPWDQGEWRINYK